MPREKQPNKTGYAVLQSLACPMHVRLVSLTAKEIRASLEALGQLSTTNCSWIVYRARNLLRESLDDWRTDRLPVMRCTACGKDSARVMRSGALSCTENDCRAFRRLRRGERAKLEALADERWSGVEPRHAARKKRKVR